MQYLRNNLNVFLGHYTFLPIVKTLFCHTEPFRLKIPYNLLKNVNIVSNKPTVF